MTPTPTIYDRHARLRKLKDKITLNETVIADLENSLSDPEYMRSLATHLNMHLSTLEFMLKDKMELRIEALKDDKRLLNLLTIP